MYPYVLFTYFLHCCYQMSGRKQVREDVQLVLLEEGMLLEFEDACSWLGGSRNREEGNLCLILFFSHVLSHGLQPMRCYYPHLGWLFLLHLILCNIPLKHTLQANSCDSSRHFFINRLWMLPIWYCSTCLLSNLFFVDFVFWAPRKTLWP